MMFKMLSNNSVVAESSKKWRFEDLEDYLSPDNSDDDEGQKKLRSVSDDYSLIESGNSEHEVEEKRKRNWLSKQVIESNSENVDAD